MNTNNSSPTHESQTDSVLPRLSRRTVLKWFATVTTAMQLPGFAADAVSINSGAAASPATKGYGTDPNIANYYQPGAFWPLTLTPEQKKTITALADVILPADKLGPAASEVRVPDYLDEWLSAPYPLQQKDRAALLPGIQWLEDEAQKRFKQSFASLTAEQHHAICDDICWPADAKNEFKKAADFFVKFRALASSAYYGTEAGWKALGYEGNTPLLSFDGPPPEVLKKLEITQTVL